MRGPRRTLLLRDSAIILVLLAATVVLYAVTAFLFSSFTRRRTELGKRYGESGKQSLARGNKARAIYDLRVSLSYSPDDSYNQLLLAEALAEANHPEEARSYFLSLLDAQPADGFINLQLARLSRQKNDPPRAIQYYRAAAEGNWDTGPLGERFQVQIELSNYLIAQHRLPAARAELLIAEADAPVTSDAYSDIGDGFLEANDQANAVRQYEKAVKLNTQDTSLSLKAARLLYQMARYADAYNLLSEVRRTVPLARLSDAQRAEFESLLENTRRIQQLTIGQDLPARERGEHLLRDLRIAKLRFAACSAKFPNNAAVSAAMQSTSAKWDLAKPFLRGNALDNEADEADMTSLVFETEELTQRFCGPPSGDDALLLVLANNSGTGH